MKLISQRIRRYIKSIKVINDYFLKMQSPKNTREENILLSEIINNSLTVEKKLVELDKLLTITIKC